MTGGGWGGQNVSNFRPAGDVSTMGDERMDRTHRTVRRLDANAPTLGQRCQGARFIFSPWINDKFCDVNR